eukprot:CAMPEP_0174853002 /NCGR_PEP_ID=MMETSP1114-20130205/27311_1 /TAXON_ID=312471 /ORGANISM="Neobodo designis, Strain CCAP 1951/1" /LENGTH=86 /DNA_ID=CAMNT_0016087623 /DNA_START=36 /DNA_END=296 /DNA_ORIENTATION=-
MATDASGGFVCELSFAFPSERAAGVASASLTCDARSPVSQVLRVRHQTLYATVKGPSARDVRTQCHALIDQLRLVTRTLAAFDKGV